MQIELKNAKLVKILEDRAEIHKNITELNSQQMKLEQEKVKAGYKMNALKDKTEQIIKKANIELQEFEFIARVYLEEGKALVDISNIIDENYKSKEEIKAEVLEQAKNREGIFKDDRFFNSVKLPDGSN